MTTTIATEDKKYKKTERVGLYLSPLFGYEQQRQLETYAKEVFLDATLKVYQASDTPEGEQNQDSNQTPKKEQKQEQNQEQNHQEERAELVHLLQDALSGSISCIFVWDFHSFSEDYLDLGYCLNDIFPKLQIRFLSYTEKYDNFKKEDRERLAHWIQEKAKEDYAKELSRKILEAKKTKLRPKLSQLQFQDDTDEKNNNQAKITKKSPYGYQKKGSKLSVDEEVAPYVKMLFQWTLLGVGRREAAERMNLLRVATPQQRKEKNCVKVERKEAKWTVGTVQKILSNPLYTGDLAEGRFRQSLYQGIHRYKTHSGEWEIWERTHEALVAKDDWEEVNPSLLEERNEQEQEQKKGQEQRREQGEEQNQKQNQMTRQIDRKRIGKLIKNTKKIPSLQESHLAIYLGTSPKQTREELLSFLKGRKELREVQEEAQEETQQGAFLKEILEYSDIKKLIEDAKSGKIHTILLKNLSELAKNPTDIQIYLEEIFPILAVRLIAVEDNYDSSHYEQQENAAFSESETLLNERLLKKEYQRGITEKRKQSIREKWQQGEDASKKPPFGYVWDEEQGGWKVEEEAASYVRMIFEQAMQGNSPSEISDAMNQKKIPTPGVYRHLQKHSKVPESEMVWDAGKIRSILSRYEYTGTLVRGKRQKIAGERDRAVTRKRTENDQIRTAHAHPAIVTEEEFEAAAAGIRKRKKVLYQGQQQFLLKGKLRCGTCRLALAYSQSGRQPEVYCIHKAMAGVHAACSAERYPMDWVEAQVWKEFNQSNQLNEFNQLNQFLTREEGNKEEKMTKESVEELLEEWIEAVYIYDKNHLEIKVIPPKREVKLEKEGRNQYDKK